MLVQNRFEVIYNLHMVGLIHPGKAKQVVESQCLVLFQLIHKVMHPGSRHSRFNILGSLPGFGFRLNLSDCRYQFLVGHFYMIWRLVKWLNSAYFAFFLLE
jgi:hypothetical protein